MTVRARAARTKQLVLGFNLDANDLKRIAYAGLFAFVAAFVPLASGAGGWRNYSDAKAAVLALLPLAIAAALSAIKNGILPTGHPAKG